MGESSIPCTEPTRDRLKALRGEGYQNWDTFLNELADAWEEKFDGSGVDGEQVSVDQLREELNTDAPTFDDVKAACEAALDEKLPEGGRR